MKSGRRCALVTLVEIIDGGARALGTHMGVSEDGRYCGFVSGGCIETAVAREAIMAISEGADRECQFGKGSPYFDIVLPCGGGLRLNIHVLRETAPIDAILTAIADRKTASLIYNPDRQVLSVHEGDASTGWDGDVFVSVQRPEPQFLISGRGVESIALAAMASAAGFRVLQADNGRIDATTDRETAVVLLHHDVDTELLMLKAALDTDAFYIGCLGSRRTHAKRIELLENEGISSGQIARIHAPIGIFGPARVARSIAVSVLAEVISKFDLWKRNSV
ncbi:XdhC family protein [Paracoccus saliphilus]|nr:XdhC family protein [Paracoccus saliphilus]